jgi:hypothetical protein
MGSLTCSAHLTSTARPPINKVSTASRQSTLSLNTQLGVTILEDTVNVSIGRWTITPSVRQLYMLVLFFIFYFFQM